MNTDSAFTLLRLLGELREEVTIATSGVSIRGGMKTAAEITRKFDKLEQAIAAELYKPDKA